MHTDLQLLPLTDTSHDEFSIGAVKIFLIFLLV